MQTNTWGLASIKNINGDIVGWEIWIDIIKKDGSIVNGYYRFDQTEEPTEAQIGDAVEYWVDKVTNPPPFVMYPPEPMPEPPPEDIE